MSACIYKHLLSKRHILKQFFFFLKEPTSYIKIKQMEKLYYGPELHCVLISCFLLFLESEYLDAFRIQGYLILKKNIVGMYMIIGIPKMQNK